LVEATLRRNNIQFEVTQGENDEKTNTLTCADDVPFEKAKQLALILLDAGVEIKSIHRHSSPAPKRFTIEGLRSVADARTLTRNDILGMNECPAFRRPPPAARPIILRNACARAPVRAYIMLKNSETNEWTPVMELPEIAYNKELRPFDTQGNDYLTNERYFYISATASSASGTITWPNETTEYVILDLPNGEKRKFQQKYGYEYTFLCSTDTSR
jgi:hypothetical protein